LVESALFAEHNISDIVNNNIILVHTDTETQLKRLQKRGDDMTTIKRFLNGQYNTENKQKLLEEKKVEGCMGPFKVIFHKEGDKEEWEAIVCDYI
jgi:hypothetical protein